MQVAREATTPHLGTHTDVLLKVFKGLLQTSARATPRHPATATARQQRQHAQGTKTAAFWPDSYQTIRGDVDCINHSHHLGWRLAGMNEGVRQRYRIPAGHFPW